MNQRRQATISILIQREDQKPLALTQMHVSKCSELPKPLIYGVPVFVAPAGIFSKLCDNEVQ